MVFLTSFHTLSVFLYSSFFLFLKIDFRENRISKPGSYKFPNPIDKSKKEGYTFQ